MQPFFYDARRHKKSNIIFFRFTDFSFHSVVSSSCFKTWKKILPFEQDYLKWMHVMYVKQPSSWFSLLLIVINTSRITSQLMTVRLVLGVTPSKPYLLINLAPIIITILFHRCCESDVMMMLLYPKQPICKFAPLFLFMLLLFPLLLLFMLLFCGHLSLNLAKWQRPPSFAIICFSTTTL